MNTLAALERNALRIAEARYEAAFALSEKVEALYFEFCEDTGTVEEAIQETVSAGIPGLAQAIRSKDDALAGMLIRKAVDAYIFRQAENLAESKQYEHI